MKQEYKDIRDKLGYPVWWDECGAPRYCKVGPSLVNDIYADEVVFLEVRCQRCGHVFVVARSLNFLEKHQQGKGFVDRLEADEEIPYGDPPNIGCCYAGPTMQSISVRVISCWTKGHHHEWVQQHQFTGHKFKEESEP